MWWLLGIIFVACLWYMMNHKMVHIILNQHPITTLEMIALKCGMYPQSNLEVHPHSYRAEYDNGKYCVCFPKSRKMRTVTKVLDQDDQDVTKDIIKCMGRTHDFHSIRTTPRMLGYSSLTITYRGGNTRTIIEDEVF